jgi:CubicO group peptidase (beta-lactamase class C family)
MRHGIAWDEWTHDFTDPRNSAVQMFASSDWYAHVLQQPRVQAPGAGFTYSSGVSTLMSGVLRKASGESPQLLFGEWLAQPLGMSNFDWELWSPTGPGTGLRNFPFDDAPLGVGLWLRPIDLLKLGRLYLAGGVHDGQRLLDSEWIERAWTRYSHAGTDAYFAASTEEPGYGYQWWFRALRDSRGRTHDCWYADGAGRQYLLICPDDDLIVVSTGSAYDYGGPGIFTALRTVVLPELRHPVTDSLSGFYVDPQLPGQGVSIEVNVARNLVALAWYTHAEGGQRWYVTQGSIENDRVRFDPVLRVEGGGFLTATPPEFIEAGSAELHWNHCNEASLSYEIDAGSGQYALQPLVSGCD